MRPKDEDDVMTIFGANETADREPDHRRLGWIRLAIGLIQGAALLGLYLAIEHRSWPATVPGLFAPLVLIFAWLPVVLLGAVGRMRLRTLVIWGLTAAALLALMGWWSVIWGVRPNGLNEPLASPVVFAASAVMLFIAHHLILPADRARRWLAPYPAYFDTAWKAGVQLALSVAFTGAFWLLLFLGAGLFSVIGLDFLRELLGQEWFSIPVTTLAFSAAVHLTDVKDGLIRGVRTVALMLLSWLMPVMALITAAFILVLPFAGVGRLWDEGYGTSLMLSAAAALIILINAAYQDGEPGSAPNVVLRWAARIAGILLVPLIGLALWGIALRIGQHGLTPERIIAAACVLVGAVHAVGYAFAAVKPGPWMRPLERTNVIGGVVAVAAILALFTPLADPARLSVADQMRRLETGRVSAEAFDYAFLRFDAGRSGLQALDRLVASDNPEIARRAGEAKAAENRYMVDQPEPERTIDVVPGSDSVPDGFLTAAPGDLRATCRNEGDCLAAASDLDGDGQIEWLVANAHRLAVYQQADDGWREIGGYNVNLCAPRGHDARDLLREGLTFAPSPLPDLSVGDTRVPLTPNTDCPA
ncbi:MAG: hypothetical protein ACI8U3_002400 [Brevundimonas sp.]|jgi:hypothetical protein|uniref:DUF4153 domain-containing protein n=1 Tax=Brevundimonas sp. TaxID=1871086 RepID=UPI0039E54D3E